jgi:hypothetical protein
MIGYGVLLSWVHHLVVLRRRRIFAAIPVTLYTYTL